LVSGVGLHAYFSRAAQGPAAVEEKRGLSLRQFENDDTVAQRIREARRRSDARMAGTYLAWAVVGVVLAIPGVRALFRMADRVRETETFLAGSVLLLLVLPGCLRQPLEPVKLETIGINEEGVSIPYTGDTTRETVFHGRIAVAPCDRHGADQ
jgi:hypothetical protein